VRADRRDGGRTGTALVPGGGRGWTLLMDGVPQSHVDPADPTHLEFEYVRRIARLVDVIAPPAAPLRVLHLGGGALTLPRYVEATRPGSSQRVVELDPAVIELVRRELPLPRRARIKLVAGDARAAVDRARPQGYDLVVADVYRAAQMPASVASAEFAAAVARALRPAGRYAVNVADLPPLAFTRRQAATLATAFGDVCAIADPGMLRGRRYGNVVLAAARARGGLPVQRLAAAVRRDPFPARVLHGADLDRFVAGARPVDDAAAEDSPRPPPASFG
jgi:spermidine synthase